MALNATELTRIAQAYLEVFPGEHSRLEALLAESAQANHDIFSRKTLPGHVTAAGFVVARSTRRVLLVEHAFLGKLLQPGGHYEKEDEDMLAAARREIQEETGLSSQALTYLPVTPNEPLVPLDFDVHDIPENPAKQEQAHQHYDFRYVFTTATEAAVTVDQNESNAAQWDDWQDFAARSPDFARIAQKIERFHLLD